MGAEKTEDGDRLSENDDFERPAKLDLIVGFLRLLCFLSVCTSVFGVIVSVLFPIQQTKSIEMKTWNVFIFMEGDRFNYMKTERVLNPYNTRRDMILVLRCTAGITQLAYLVFNAIFVTIDSIATTTFRLSTTQVKATRTTSPNQKSISDELIAGISRQ